MNLRSLVLVAASLGVVACVGTTDRRPAAYAKLRTRAAFDMRCKAADVKITPLDEWDTQYVKAPKSAGVSCGDQQGTYLFDDRHDVWMLNTDSHPDHPDPK